MHKRDYGNHDECMKKCAVVVPDEEKDWVLNNGTELGDVNLPSLRRLFQIAVGDDPGPTIDTQSGVEDRVLAGHLIAQDQERSRSHLTRTLGHHKDTPALAPFLGRTAERRRINVFDDDVELVDIVFDEREPSAVPFKQRWRMPFAARNTANPGLDIIPDCSHPDPSPEYLSLGLSQQDVKSAVGSRFHIVARLVVSDRSLWLPHRE